MPRPHFNPELIDALKARVIAHNKTDGATPVRLQELRKAYAAGYRGRDPEAGALAKVDDLLNERLAKIWPFDPTDHPRDDDGKFTSKGRGKPAAAGKPAAVAVRLPQTRAEHERLIQDNAGYAAMQTAVIPEARNAVYGATIRDIGSLVGGAAVAASLARKGKSGLVGRAVRSTGGAAGDLLGGYMASAASTPLSLAGRLTSKALGRETWASAAMRNAKMNRMILGASKRGRQAGRATADLATEGVGRAIRYLADRGGDSASSRVGRTLRRGAIIGTIGGLSGWSLRNTIRGTVFDPEVTGHAMDAMEYREVKKLLDDAALGDAQAAMLEALNKGGDLDDLRKALKPLPGMWSRAGSALWSGAAAVGGALAGAGAAHIGGVVHDNMSGGQKRKGNPYHDEHGKFSSAANAHSTTWQNAAGALLGGLAAGGLTYAAMRRGHTNLLRGEMAAINRRQVGRVTRITEQAGVGRLGRRSELRVRLNDVNELKRNRESEIADWIKTHKDMKTIENDFERFAGSSELHYRGAIQNEVNQRIANAAAFLDDFQIQVNRDGKKVWASVGQLRNEIGGKSPHAAIQKDIHNFLNRATDEQFVAAIKNVKGDAQVKLAELHANRTKWVAAVPDQIAGHYRDLGEAEAKVGQLRVAHETAKDALTQADTAHTLTPGDAEAKALAAAQKSEKAALSAYTKAAAEMEKLKSRGAEIKSPLTGEPIKPATGVERAALSAKMAEDLRPKAEKAINKKIKGAEAEVAKARSDQINFIAAIGSKNRANLARVGARYGGLPKAVRPMAERAAAAADAADEAESAWKLAISKKETKETIDGLKGKHDEAIAALTEASDAFEKALLGGPKAGPRLRIIPDWLLADLRHDIAHGTGNIHRTAKAFMARPTMKRLEAFANAKYQTGKQAGRKAARLAFMAPDPSNPGQFKFSPMRTFRNVGLATTVGPAVGVGLYDRYVDTRDAVRGDPHARRRLMDQLRQTLVREVDPITGAGYMALTVPHPTEKGERIVLFGEHQKNDSADPQRLVVGGKVSGISRAFKDGRLGQGGQGGQGGGEGGGGNHTGDLQNLHGNIRDRVKSALERVHNEKSLDVADIPDAPGVRVAFLRSGSSDHGAAAGLIQFLQNQFLNPGKGRAADGGERDGFFNSLNAAFSKQAQVLTARQRYEILTNRNPGGGKGRYGHGIFGNSDQGFASNDHDKLVSDLGNAVDHALKLGPTGRDKANLHRAVHIVGVEKNISNDKLRSIHQKIAGHQVGERSAQPVARVGPDNVHKGEPKMAKPEVMATHYSTPSRWDEDELKTVTEGSARSLKDRLPGNVDQTFLARTIANISKGTAHAHALDMQNSVRITTRAIRELVAEGSGLKDLNEYTVAQRIEDLVSAARSNNKYLDDLDGLMKSFASWEESKHPRQGKGSDQGGEFTSRGGGPVTHGRPSTAAPARPARARAPAVAPQTRGEFHPASLMEDAGSAAGMQAAWDLASKFLPTGRNAKDAILLVNEISSEAGGRVGEKVGTSTLTNVGMKIAERFLPPAVGIASMGAKLMASAAGSAAGQFGGEKAAAAAYRVAGKELPGRNEKEDSLGRMAAETVGDIAGNVIGGAVAAPFGGVTAFGGAVAGGVIGNKIGGGIYDLMHTKTGHRISQWFDGYTHEMMNGAIGRFMGNGR